MTQPIFLVPLAKLLPSPKNVRKASGTEGLGELAASIAAHGLINPLRVESHRTAKGKPTDKFAVLAGGRRLAALKLNAGEGRCEPDYPVPCIEGTAELSLAENSGRLALHPCDQAEAFAELAGSGVTVPQLAARYGIAERTVLQRLKLAEVSPRIRDAYRAGEASLDQMMALTLTDDQARQEALWFAGSRAPSAYQVRQALTEGKVPTTDPRARFIGLDALRAAGIEIERDLFAQDGEGYIADLAALDRLAAEKLEACAAAVRAEGWAWVETTQRLGWDVLNRYSREYPEPCPLGEDDQQRRDALAAEYDELVGEGDDELPPDPKGSASNIAQRVAEIEVELGRLDEAGAAYSPATLAMAGAIVSMTSDGAVRIERGLVRPEDRRRAAADAQAADPDTAASPRPLSAALVADLTAHRTAALQFALSTCPDLALRVLAHTLSLGLFYGPSLARSASSIRFGQPDLGTDAWEIPESAAGRQIAVQAEAWLDRLPEVGVDLWHWLTGQPAETVTELLAACTGHSLDAICHNPQGATPHADQIHAALGLDMADWWTPTAARYLGRVPKSMILDALAEASSAEIAHAHRADKKDKLIAFAADLLTEKRWLPAILRSPAENSPTEVAPAADAGSGGAEISDHAIAAE